MERITIDVKKIDKSEIAKAASMLSQGKIVAMPTETVYGLAVRADKKNGTLWLIWQDTYIKGEIQ